MLVNGNGALLMGPCTLTRTCAVPAGTLMVRVCAPTKSDDGTLITWTVDAVPVRVRFPDTSCSVPSEGVASQPLLIVLASVAMN
jgi:hypothetical protein